MLKIHPDLALAVLRARRDREYRLWLLCRSLDDNGSGWIALDRLREVTAGLSWRGLTWGTIRKLIIAGEGIFWRGTTQKGKQAKGRRLYLCSLDHVCLAFNVDRLRCDPVLLTHNDAGTLSRFRAACQASMFAGLQFSRPVSRMTLAALTGYTTQTTRNWQKKMGGRMEVQPNASVVNEDAHARLCDLAPLPENQFYERVGDHLVILRRLPNSYRVTMPIVPRGRTRKVNGKLKAMNPGRKLANGPSAGGLRPGNARLYYAAVARDRKALIRRMEQLTEDDLFLGQSALVGERTCHQSRSGIDLWTCFHIIDRQLYGRALP